MNALLTLIAAFLGLLSASAAEHGTQTFAIDGKAREFESVVDKHLTISADCVRSSGVFECEAFRALSRASLKGHRPKGGSNPGAAACTKSGGTVTLGRDADGNENGFCRFKDGSVVDNGTLYFYARKNDHSNQ